MPSKMSSRGEVNAERLDGYVDLLKCLAHGIAIERVARHLLEFRILDWDACGRARQGPNTMAGAKGGFYRFKSNAAAGTYDENLGHASFSNICFRPSIDKQIT